ncbi:MAG: ATP-binding protein [Lachnospiraceae bacterium]|nr:ATP-binding protein [Lachnospiraceae bacterium]MBR6151751.1 ATP-binding protein [Lachnospiraceae bacterium]
MTYAEMLPSLLFSNLIGTLSVFAEAFLTLSTILIPLCFFGREGKLKKSTFIITGILPAYAVISNTLASINAIIYSRQHAAEVLKTSKALDMTLIQTACVFLAAITVYSRHKLLHGIENVIYFIVIELYQQFMITCSMSFLADDILEFYNSTGNLMAVLPKAFNLYILCYFLVALLLFLGLYLGLYRRKRFFYVSYKYRILFVIWEFFLLYSVVKPLNHAGENAGLFVPMKNMIGIMLPVLGIAFPFLIMIMVTRRSAMEKTVLQEGYIAAELEYIDQYKRSQEETRAFRHDIANNLSLLSAMMGEGKYEEAEQYLNDLLGNVRGMSPKYVTGDEMLDCLVGMKAGRMEEAGIAFSIDGVADGGLSMKPTDICSIFANALDNAIEACENMPEERERIIRLEIKKAGQFFAIKLINTYEERTEGIILGKLFDGKERRTSKKDKSLHGYGAQNIKATVEKNNGILKSEAGEGWFTLSVMIPRQ